MDKRVYLLGAGFSCAISDEMPIMTSLSTAVEEQLRRERYKVPDYNTPLKHNFEQWLSYLVDSPPWLTEADQLANQSAFRKVSFAVSKKMIES